MFTRLPDSAIASLTLLAVLGAALVIVAILTRAARRLLRRRYPSVVTWLYATNGALQFTAVLLALRLVVTSVPLDAGTRTVLALTFQAGFIVLVGWLSIVAVRTAAQIYLRRFQTDTADNILARKHITQVRILTGAANTLIVILTVAAVLMSFEAVRQFGVSLAASAGLAGIAVGFAARPILSNLIAGIQLAITQPIHIDDVVTVEGETGRVEEITSTYVVVRVWDHRTLIVPLTTFIEKPFQNVTRGSSRTIGTVFLHVDYAAPIERLRKKFEETVRASPLWDGDVVLLQVTEARPNAVELRGVVSARNGADAFNLRCAVREQMIAFMRDEAPDALVRSRQNTVA